MLLTAWENEQALIEKKEKEVSRQGLGGARTGKQKGGQHTQRSRCSLQPPSRHV